MKALFLLLSFLLPTIKYKNIYNHFVTSCKEVAITFDDGPDPKNTYRVLDVLKEKGVKATFFMLGQNKDVIKRVYKEGHRIGIHSFSHPNFYKLNYNQIKKEIVDTQKAIFDVTGYCPYIIRPPYGILANEFLKVAEDLKLKVYTWNVDTFDWKSGNTVEDIIQNGLKKISNGSIILMHDRSKNQDKSLKALPVIIDKIREMKYEFKTLK